MSGATARDTAVSGEQSSTPSREPETETSSVAAGSETAPAGAQTSGERVEGLDRDLERSLEEIDGILLEEQQRLAREAGAAAGGSGADAADAGAGGTGDPSGDGAVESGPTTETDTTGGSESMPAGGGETPDSEESTDAGGGTTGDDRSRVPPDVGDGSDDDIVARQLREAAMEEEDPELRERLWDEYREYKRSTSAQGGSDEG